jgi:hypothetical protein
MTLTYSPQEFAGQLSSYAAEGAEYRWYIERVPGGVKRYRSQRMVHTTLQSAGATRRSRGHTADACVTEQTTSPFPAKVLATQYPIDGCWLSIKVTENSNALHNSDSFGGAVAAWAGYLLHDGWIPSHPARTCRHHDPGASHPRSAHLSRRSAAEVVMSIPNCWRSGCLHRHCEQRRRGRDT